MASNEIVGEVIKGYVRVLQARGMRIPTAPICKILFDAIGEIARRQPDAQGNATDILLRITRLLPPQALRSWEDFRAGKAAPDTHTTSLTVALYDLIPDIVPFIYAVSTDAPRSPCLTCAGTGTVYKRLIDRTQRGFPCPKCDGNGYLVSSANDMLKAVKDELGREPTKRQIIEYRLANSPWRKVLECQVPFRIPDNLRYEHGFAVAGAGGGKTTLIQNLVLDDLSKDDPPGMVVLDVKNEMVQEITRLNVFHPDHGRLRDRLIFIDPLDLPALSIFDVPEHPTNDQVSAATEAMQFVMRAILNEPLTGPMDAVFGPLMGMALRHPDRSLRLLQRMAENTSAFRGTAQLLPEGQREFALEHLCNPKDTHYHPTKMGIVTRLQILLGKTTLNQIFAAKKNFTDLAQALNDGKIILVSTQLPGELAGIFGRFFISQVVSAAKSRKPQTGRPVHLYVDEGRYYIDESTEDILTFLRTYHVGSLFVFQEIKQMAPYQSTFSNNTAFKFMGSVGTGDAHAFAVDMDTDVAFIRQHGPEPVEDRLPQWVQFAAWTRLLRRSVTITAPTGLLETNRMNDADYDRLRARNRALVRGEHSAAPVIRSEPKAVAEERVDTAPEEKWRD